MLNSGTQNLNQILSMRRSVNNRNGLGYTDVTRDVAMTSKTIFFLAVATSPKPFVSGKIFKPALLKVKRFVPTCHF